MNSLRNLIALLLMASSTAALAQVVAQSAGGGGTPVNPPNMSQDQIVACIREIAMTYQESKNWPGNENDVTARLGRFEKELFEGRCAGHPDAQRYIKSGTVKLARVGSASANLPTASSVASSSQGGSSTPGSPAASAGSPSPSENASTTVPLRRGANSGSALFQQAINQAEQDEKDRPAREARERAAKARAAEAQRLASEKAAADLRAYEQEKAQKDAREFREGLGQLLGAVGQYQQDRADRKQAQYEEQQRRLLAQQEQQRSIQEQQRSLKEQQNEEQQRRLQAQQEQQRSIQEQQRSLKEQQNRAYVAEAARAEAFNRESALAAEQRAKQKSSPAIENTARGKQIQNNPPSNQPQRSASEPGPMGHIPMGLRPNQVKGAFINPSADRVAQEAREQEREHKENVRRHEEEMRRKQAERAEAQRQREAEERRQLQEKAQAKATERSNLEAKIRNAIFASGAVVQYIDNQACQSIFTNTTAYWVTVVWDYTVTIEDNTFGTRSHQPQWAGELGPGQTRPAPIFNVWGSPNCREAKWRVPGGAITKKDNLNNYPYHLR